MTTAEATHVRPANVETILRDVEARFADNPGEVVELDWRHISRLEGPAGAALAAALVGTLAEVPLHVKLEPPTGATHWLLSSGLAFALANRAGETTVEGLQGEELDRWRRTWTPGTQATWRQLFGAPPSETLFSPEEVGESPLVPDLFGPNYAAFANPHRLGSTVAHQNAVTRVVWPWLDRLLPQAKRRRRSRSRDEYIGNVGLLVDELVSNAAEHGTALGFGPSIHSLVQVIVTRGGGSRSFDRLRLTVWDTGAGIPATARPKIGSPPTSEFDDESLVETLFAGRRAGWLRGRGMGLPEVAAVCRQTSGSRLFVATGAVRLAGEGRRELRRLTPGFPLQGTVIAAVLPVQF
jgi:hypothetical protein